MQMICRKIRNADEFSTVFQPKLLKTKFKFQGNYNLLQFP